MTESKTEQSETLLVEELSRKISDVTQELNQLKNWLDDLSMEEKNTRLVGIESLIIDCSENLEDLESDTTTFRNKGELQELRVKVDTLIWQKEELRNQIGSQIQSVDGSNQSVTENQNDGQQTEEWQWKKWLRKWWSSLTDKEKKSVRTVWWLAWLWILWLWIFRWRRYDYEKEIPWYSEMSRKKKREARRELRQKKRKERRENRPWWQKFLIWWAIAGWTVVGGVQVYKNWNRIKSWVKEKLWKSLTFEESISSVEAEVYNWVHKEDNFWKVGAHFQWIHFNEETSEVESFWEITKIDYKKKTIYTPNGEGIWKVQFSDWKELLHAVNIVNFAKRALKWRASNPKPFTVSSVWWDIDFEWTEFMGASGSNFWTYLLWWVWAAGGWLLWWYCAWIKWAAIWTVAWWLAGYVWWSVIDNESTMNNICPTIKKWTNLHLFVNYLNDQKKADWSSFWESIWEQETKPDNTTPIHTYLNKLIHEIELSYWNWSEDSDKRNLEAEMDANDPTIYTIKSYNQAVKIKLEWCTAKPWEVWLDFSHITNMRLLKYDEKDKFEWLNIDFPNNEEWLTELIRTANLTNKLREEFKGEWKEKYPFHYTSNWGNGVTESLKISVDRTWRNPSWLTEILSKQTCKDKFPTLFKDLKKYSQVWSFWSGVTQENLNDQAVRNWDTWSQYIKYLHQMWNWRYWKS